LLQGILPLAPVYLTKTVVDALVQPFTAAVNAGGASDLLVAADGAALLLMEVCSSLTQWLRATQADMVQIMSAD